MKFIVFLLLLGAVCEARGNLALLRSPLVDPTYTEAFTPWTQCLDLRAGPKVPWDFAKAFSTEELADPVRRTALLNLVMYWEGHFHRPGLAYNTTSGLTYDGQAIALPTGTPIGEPRPFSAPSKESLHLSLLARALEGNCLAQLWVSPLAPASARGTALDLLDRKITSFENFNRDYPGFGGFLPWFATSDQGAHPLPGWERRVPSIDNGELAWAMMAVVQALEQAGQPKLALRYQAWIALMASNAHRMFFAPTTGLLRGEVSIPRPERPPREQTYSSPPEGYYLKDPFEGELFTLFWSLYARPTRHQVRQVWRAQPPELIDVKTAAGPVTVRKGWYFSSHEEWNLLQAPYLDVPLVRRVLHNNQRLRTIYSRERGIPGLFASAHLPQTGPLTYASNLGLPEAASQSGARTDVAVPYAAFPVIMLDPIVGLAWYLRMLQHPGIQGPLGGAEAASARGPGIAPVATWDAKATVVLALLGGSGGLARDYLRRTGRERAFRALLAESYAHGVLGRPLRGEEIPLALPPRRE